MSSPKPGVWQLSACGYHLTHHVPRSDLQRTTNTAQGTRKATSAVPARRRQATGAQAATYFIRIRSAVAVAVIEGWK